MKKIKNIVFDFGGVLIDWNPHYLYNTYFTDRDKMDYFLANICTGNWNLEQDRGRPLAEATKSLQAQYPAYKEAIQLFYSEWYKMLKGEIKPTIKLLHHCKAKGYKIFGLSNWSAETFPIALKKYDFWSAFDGIVLSGNEKLVKPDPRLYQRLLHRYSLQAEECLFIDDNSANIEAALALGFNVALFDNPETVAAQLAKQL